MAWIPKQMVIGECFGRALWLSLCADARPDTSNHAFDKFQLLSNLCDLGISSSAAGLTQINEGLIGICGVISSGIGIYRQVVPTS
jgi:hypothetical protein